MGSEAVVDMSAAIRTLDPDVSQFTTMLMKLGSASFEGYDMRPGARWPITGDSGSWGDFEWIGWETARDKTREAIAYFEKQMRPEPVISWMEDELFPRVGRVLRGDGQYLRAGDIVRVVGSGK